MFSNYEAVGNFLLRELVRTQDLPSETYWAHASLDPETKSIALVTNRRVYVLRSAQLWAGWSVDKNIPISNLVAVPQVEGNRLIFATIKVFSCNNCYFYEA
jgi:hypothetical protein